MHTRSVWMVPVCETSVSETTSLAWSRVQYNFEPTTNVLSEYGILQSIIPAPHLTTPVKEVARFKQRL